MSDDLNPKQLRFCAEYVIDLNGTQAAIRAGYSPRTAKEMACRLMTYPKVQAEVARLQEQIAANNSITVARLLAEAEEARGVARAKDNGAAMVSATTLKAKLAGLLIEKTKDLTRRDELERNAERRELKTAARLLADAAESLGLDRTATPAQIVGALAERPIATPEAFRLLQAMAQAKADEGLL